MNELLRSLTAGSTHMSNLNSFVRSTPSTPVSDFMRMGIADPNPPIIPGRAIRAPVRPSFQLGNHLASHFSDTTDYEEPSNIQLRAQWPSSRDSNLNIAQFAADEAPAEAESASPAGFTAAETAAMGIGEGESVADDMPDPAPIIAGGALIGKSVMDSKAAEIAQGGTAANKMAAGNISRMGDNMSQDVVAGTSFGSMLGPLGSLVGAGIGGLISGITTHINKLNTTSGQAIDPASPAAAGL